MKGDLIYEALRLIEDGVTTLIDLELAIAKSGGYASGKKIDFNFDKIHNRRKFVSDWFFTEEGKQEKRRLGKLISKLKFQGLIEKGNDEIFFLTNLGRKKKDLLRSRKENSDFIAGEDKTFKIIAFDIPNSRAARRDWLRSCLKNLGFKMLQKSVWIGKVKIPKEFLSSLDRFGLLDDVEILEITKTGSVKEF